MFVDLVLTTVYILRMIEVIESATFKRWIRGLRDRSAVARVNARLRNISMGNAGDAKPIGGGLFEMRVHYGPGYRLYFLREDACGRHALRGRQE